MKKINKSKNENQMEFNFQAVSKRSLKQEKEIKKSDKPVLIFNTAKVQGKDNKAKLSDISLPKGFNESKVKKISYGCKKPSALFFGNLITVEELAVVFRLAPRTIRNWIVLRKIPYVKIGRWHFFQKESAQEWLNQKEKPQWQ